MPLRVVLDVTSTAFPPSGIRTYVEALTARLIDDPSLDLVEIGPAPGAGAPPSVRTRAGRLVWDALGAARAAVTVDGAVLHVPHNAAPLRSRLPVVSTVHDVIPWQMAEYRQSRAMALYLRLMRKTLMRSAAVIVPTAWVAGEVTEALDLDPARITVVPMGVDERFRPPADRERLPPALTALGVRRPYLFTIGGFDVRKNLPLLIEAFAILRRDLPQEIQLIIGGAPHTRNPHVFPPIEPLIARHGVEGATLLTGRISDELVVALYQHAQCYVSPSLAEGFGLTVLEAMACGIPTVGIASSCLPEVVGDAGLLVPPVAAELAEAIAAVLTSPDLAHSLSQRGRARAAAFSWDATARATAAVYHRVAGQAPNAGQPR